MKPEPLRVIHAPTTVGGNPQGLSRALRRDGVESTALAVDQNYFAYPTDVVLNRPGDSKWTRERRRLRAIFKILPQYDVVHYNFGTTIAQPHPAFIFGGAPGRRQKLSYWLRAKYQWLLQLLELSNLRRRGIPIFMTYQGDDARQGEYQRRHFPISIASQVEPTYYNPVGDAFKQASIKRMDRYCTRIYALNPDLLRVLPGRAEFVPYSHVFMDEWLPCYTQAEDRPLRIAHAPSHRGVKGTHLVLEALDRLKAKGREFELVLVENLPNHEAKRRYETADVLIDQLFAGWYGGLAVEAMALGKPVIVYIRQEDLQYIDPAMAADLPFIEASPDTIEVVLERVLAMPRTELLALARKSRAFVEKWHDPQVVAARIKADYEQALGESKSLGR
ncbi:MULTISPECIES: glycosyltransferase family 1 protein [Achromobacter]|uniref:glycosyltransferase family 1 protein n=1 Tax=Achromobacter TaxID=222 RepID=UPI001CC20D17|nr:glycosyltransferase family 1 protein [Achromobacter xylosoxidans]